MTMRFATPSDLTAVQTCARKAYARYVPRIGRDPAPMVADFAAQIAQQLVHVIEVDEAIVGFVVFYPRDDHIHLENVAVGEAMQGRGIGSRLVDFVEEQARASTCSAVELYTNEKMTENIPFYLNRGYVEVGRREEDGFSRIFFRKEL